MMFLQCFYDVLTMFLQCFTMFLQCFYNVFTMFLQYQIDQVFWNVFFQVAASLVVAFSFMGGEWMLYLGKIIKTLFVLLIKLLLVKALNVTLCVIRY
jgi:hypothetical protein